MIEIIGTSGELREPLWASCRPFLEQAVDQHPGESLDFLEELGASVGRGERMLLQIIDRGEGPAFDVLAAALLEFGDYRDGRCLTVRYLGGVRMSEWIAELEQRLADIGRAYGCAWVALTGRQGWRRALRELEWEPVAIQMRARI